eukprot:GHVO01017300.1.p1 GENE.GHVO01017300.1~~GHVO01017300.1.p1  ORF type:complete len:101 (+),score=21.32 GHVO01017300.1:213-515(+)
MTQLDMLMEMIRVMENVLQYNIGLYKAYRNFGGVPGEDIPLHLITDTDSLLKNSDHPPSEFQITPGCSIYMLPLIDDTPPNNMTLLQCGVYERMRRYHSY